MAIARFRRERNDALDRWSAERSEWRAELGDRARALFEELNADQRARAAFRQEFSRQVGDKRRSFLDEREEARVAEVSQRSDFLAKLVSSVNRLIADCGEARDSRREWARGLSSDVAKYLSNCRESRTKISAAQVSALKSFRSQVSSSALRACTDDF
jgi:hypothetical protein